MLAGGALSGKTVDVRTRRRGRRFRGVLLSLAGAGVLSASGYLGGHLVFRLAAGVDQDGDGARPAPAVGA